MARPWTGSPRLPSDHRYAMGWRSSVVTRWGGRWDGSSVELEVYGCRLIIATRWGGGYLLSSPREDLAAFRVHFGARRIGFCL